MQSEKSSGLMLMGVAVAAFLGSTADVLPAATFFPALALAGLGGMRFFKASRAALAEVERKAQEKVRPVIRENRSTIAQAERAAARRGAAVSALNADAQPARAAGRARIAASRATREASGGPLGRVAPATDVSALGAGQEVAEIDLLDEQEGDLEISSDVSFPVEVQRGDALADQLRKLNLLLTQGILTEEEYAIAKAKLLG